MVKGHFLHHKKVEGICIVHEMKDMNVVYLLMYLILRKSEQVKIVSTKLVFFILFLIVYISINFVLGRLKF